MGSRGESIEIVLSFVKQPEVCSGLDLAKTRPLQRGDTETLWKESLQFTSRFPPCFTRIWPLDHVPERYIRLRPTVREDIKTRVDRHQSYARNAHRTSIKLALNAKLKRID